MSNIKISTALISVYNKEGLSPIIKSLQDLEVKIFSTGGTLSYIKSLGADVDSVEELTGYPSILDGRVKTLHPKVFGGILARGEDAHIDQLEQYQIPRFDLVVIDLYPFEETVKSTSDTDEIIEKIDIGGISLIRAGAKNYKDIVVISRRDDYGRLLDILQRKSGVTHVGERKDLARRAFMTTAHYDVAIYQYFNENVLLSDNFKLSMQQYKPLRYGENPHQRACFYGEMEECFEKLGGKDISYNNLVDIDAAIALVSEFREEKYLFAIIKHTNACGVAVGESTLDAWKRAFASDPISAFGGILISNSKIDLETAEAIQSIFFEVLIAPDFDENALESLLSQKNRIIMKLKMFPDMKYGYKSILGGVIVQEMDHKTVKKNQMIVATQKSPEESEWEDLYFANICVKHLKSNAIAIVKNKQLLGIGSGQTARIDACKLAIEKAQNFGFDTKGAVLASDAFFPFPDCVDLAHQAGITAVIQPGGSIKDKLSIDFCNEKKFAMVFTSTRHFKH